MASETRTDGIKVRLRAATKLIRNSSIRSKLVAMLLVPIAGILVFAGLQITSRYSQLSENQSIERMTELVERSSAVFTRCRRNGGRALST